MYRISFNTTYSRFVVQVLYLGLFWDSCREEREEVRFETYAEAQNWVKSIGLDQAYPEQVSRALYRAN